MSEDQAFKRIRAARAVRRYPVLLKAVAEGRVHLGGVLLLAAHLTDQNAEELIAEASGKSKADIEILLARRAPRPDVPARIERVAGQMELAPGPVGEEAEPQPARVAPLAAERFALQVTIGKETQEKLMRVQALLRHRVPSGDLAEVLDWVLDAGLEKLEKRKLGKTCAPRKARASGSRRHVPNEVRREAVARDGLRCSFVSEDGRRCEETGFLELDHVVPVALGGEASDEVRILCRAHNQFEAERILGRETVEAGKARAIDDDLVAGLRRLGVTASDARRAVASARSGTLEERLRAALTALRTIYASRAGGTRCAEPRAQHIYEARRCESGQPPSAIVYRQ
jgi:hypothetical protein